MNSRRKFVKQGALATTALLALRPFESLAGVNFLTASPGGTRHLVFLHTTESEARSACRYIANLRERGIPALALNTATRTADFQYDVQTSPELFEGEYVLIKKEGIRTGIIRVEADRQGLADHISRLATYLKEVKDCQLVICISRLGYKNEFGTDDCQLAYEAQQLDLIIGAHPENRTRFTRTVFNRDRKEVILQSDTNEQLPCGKIEIAFDENGRKRHIHVATRLYQDVNVA
jgi:hypothetical protein